MRIRRLCAAGLAVVTAIARRTFGVRSALAALRSLATRVRTRPTAFTTLTAFTAFAAITAFATLKASLFVRLSRRATTRLRGNFVRLWNVIRHALARNLELDESFDLLQETALFDVAERDRVARLACARGTSDAVDVRLRLHRKVVVHDVRDIVDIEPACGNVGRHKNR
jgi:hypothetical protein